ncbi:DNA polymerase II large subunit [Candidatus Woesearchaeota archaeon]|nr:DNA polymerase II large subunit [Candidatus Woesearchaeota archaeon]
MNASPDMQKYFDSILERVRHAHEVATAARKQGYDPNDKVEVQLAKNMAERVVGLISVVAPQLVGSGVVERIQELEEEYGALDWRVALKIAEEISQEKFCKFKDQKEAMDIGIRTGFAYSTVGVVSSPLDGMIGIEFKKRLDGRGEYMCVNYAGPIRNAGGTNAALSVLIADHVRKIMGYDVYDATEDEIKRASTELQDYHERVTNLQYFPSEKEVEFLMRNLPVEVGADPSEQKEVSNYKDLPRVPTNNIRSGFCLVLSSCIPLKAPKLWKKLSKWGHDLGIDQWDFLEEFLKIQKEVKAKKTGGEKKSTEKISPDYTYVADLVAGRPVLGYPLRSGGFRLRYGRSRVSGYSAQSMHPATMYILNQYIAMGTQLKTERPGKAASMTMCDTIEGPIVKLEDGEVLQISTLEQAKQFHKKVIEIIYLGDVLVAYGDFLDRAHPLVPPGYCEEWWEQELEKNKGQCKGVPTGIQAIKLSRETGTPLHPKYTPFFTQIDKEQFKQLYTWLRTAKLHEDRIVLEKHPAKRALELIAVPHKFVNNTFVVIEGSHAQTLREILQLDHDNSAKIAEKSVLETVNDISPIKVRDRAGIFIGTRMGRPEKGKQRKLTGSPHVLFPIGDEGGRLRSFQSALEEGKVTSDFPFFYCKKCEAETVLPICEVCGEKTTRMWKCSACGLIDKDECEKHGKCKASEKRAIPIKHYFDSVLKQFGIRNYPPLIKGVRGTSNSEHMPEYILKGVYRAQYNIHVYKDGTTRYDMTQLPITHFKPKEALVSVEQLKELGYTKDIHGAGLENEEQIVELKPQDILLPTCDDAPEAGADKVMLSISKFVDDLLVNVYKLKPFYNAKTPMDLVGHLTIALAPHTSAGTVARIAGYTRSQGLFAHPLMHAATRRDCDGDEACTLLLMDAFLNFSKKFLPESRGGTMDTPLVLTSVLNPKEVDDMAFNVDTAKKYPLEFYEAAQEYKMPWDVKIPTIGDELGKPGQYEGMGFTHDIGDINNVVKCSAYKTLPSMQEKLTGQMDIAEKVRAVDTKDVATLVIEKHFLKDTKGNLRKFSMQEFRCVKCNTKFRRPPLIGKCTECGGKIIFTIAEGSVIKYLAATTELAQKYNVSNYLKQTVELLQKRVDEVFGKDKEKQMGLAAFA